MNISLKYPLILISIFIGLNVTAQVEKKSKKMFDRAREDYSSGNIFMAIETAKNILDKDSLYMDVHLFLADIYHEIDSFPQEIFHLNKVLTDSSGLNSLLYFRLGEAYFSIGEYNDALKAYKECELITTDNSKRKIIASDKIKRCNFSINSIKNPISASAISVGDGVNTNLNEYWPNLTIDGSMLVFNRLIPDSTKKIYQEDFYSSKFVKGVWQKAEPLSDINTPENEGAQTLSANGKLLFFSACNRFDGEGSCDIYFSRFINGKWQKPVNAGQPVNTRSWESQPSVSANGNYLYFASNRDGGKGKMDIWRCRLYGFNMKGKPEWGVPENLGDKINTAGNELSPFIHFNGKTLFFSSDEWIGMGKKDIFYSNMNEDGTWSTPKNMGYPVNSYNDEQGLVVDATGKRAYYSTDRVKGNGLDIYSFILKDEQQPDPATYVKGIVLDKNTKQPIDAELDLIDIKKNLYLVKNIKTDEKGEFLICLPLGRNYAFNASKKGYLFHSESFELTNVRSVKNPIELKIYLEQIQEGLNIVLKNIYFETDSYELLPESMPEIDELVKFLNQNPTIAVEIEGHTDKVGTAEYNQILSEKRAKEVFYNLVKSGIAKERLTYKGYGFSRPATLEDTAWGNQLNRRTEIKITGIGK